MSEHARVSPSSAELLVECPGSVSMRQRYPEPESEDAKEGTAAHWVALRLAAGTDLPENSTAFNGAPITNEMIEYGEQFMDLVDASARGGRYYEERIEIPAIHPTEAWGTVDAAAIDFVNRVIRLYDYKYGHRFVEAYANWQMASYLSGLYSLTDGGADWKFEATIFQPRNFHRDGPVRVWRPSVAELSEQVRHLRSRAEDALSDDPWTRAGPHCLDCSARHACRTLQTANMQVLDHVGDSVPLDLLPAQVGRELTWLTRAAAILKARISGLEAQSESIIRGGGSVDGWALDRTNGRENWTIPVSEIQALADTFGVPLLKSEPVTPAQARKAGVPPALVDKASARRPGTVKLVPVNPLDATKALSQPGAITDA